MSLSKRVRFDILRAFNFTCVYCGRKAPDVVLEVDHVIPISRDGGNHRENLVAACEDCNRGKSNTFLSVEALREAEWIAEQLADEWFSNTAEPDLADLWLRAFPDCLFEDRQRRPIIFDFDIYAAAEELYPAESVYAMAEATVLRKAATFDACYSEMMGDLWPGREI